jgi:hypothetical protein
MSPSGIGTFRDILGAFIVYTARFWTRERVSWTCQSEVCLLKLKCRQPEGGKMMVFEWRS